MSNRRQVSPSLQVAGATPGPIGPKVSAHPYEIGQCIWPIAPPYLFNALNNK
jgi:hypothetical protein